MTVNNIKILELTDSTPLSLLAGKGHNSAEAVKYSQHVNSPTRCVNENRLDSISAKRTSEQGHCLQYPKANQRLVNHRDFDKNRITIWRNITSLVYPEESLKKNRRYSVVMSSIDTLAIARLIY